MNVTLPDGTILEDVPDGTTRAQLLSKLKANGYDISKLESPAQEKPKQETSAGGGIAQGAGNVLAGLVRGAGSIGSTLLAPYDIASDVVAGKGLSLESNRQRREAMDSALKSMGAEPDSFGYGAGKFAGEVAGTMGAGAGLANVVGRAAPKVAVAFPNVLNAMRSGGFGANGVGANITGGAISGGASALLANPEDVATGAAIGAVLPAAVTGIAGAAKNAFVPENQRLAKKIVDLTGKKTSDVLSGVGAQGPSILGISRTVPQILQDPTISQLQRSVAIAGDNSILTKQATQNAARLDGLNRVGQVYDTVNEAADIAGNTIGKSAKASRAEASQNVNRLFDSVDPFGESGIELPINALRAAKSKYQGAGTFGKGNEAQNAIDTAIGIGTTELPGIKAASEGASQSLEQAVRAAGGIKRGSLGGELSDLGIKQSGTTGLINNKSGKPIDLLAEEMHLRGFIPDDDPATLLNMLRNGEGRNVFANDATESGFQLGMEAAMGDAPAAERIMKPIPFNMVQNFRGSLNEAWRDASIGGRNQEAAALNEMIKNIDNKVAEVAAGRGNSSEFFPPDMVQAWKDALSSHAAKKARFDTGPQARMFRKAGDGSPAIQGAEIPREFFNPRASQVEDMQAFKRLIDNNQELENALKSYAMTDAANQVTKDGSLSFNKLNQWSKNRSGALTQLLSEQDRALFDEILQGVKATDIADTLGMAKGSNTAQNLEAAKRLLGNGVLDSNAVNILANRIPFVGNFTGPILESMRKTAQTTKAEKIGHLLSDSDLFADQLKSIIARESSKQRLSKDQIGALSKMLMTGGVIASQQDTPPRIELRGMAERN